MAKIRSKRILLLSIVHCWFRFSSNLTFWCEKSTQNEKNPSFIGLWTELSQTILPEMSVVNLSYSKRWVCVQR